MPTVTVAGRVARMHFDAFTLEDYRAFLKAKKLPEKRVNFDPEQETYEIETSARFAALMGAEAPPKLSESWTPSPHLYVSQRHIVKQAIDDPFSCFADCGRGKTSIGLEYARARMQLNPEAKGVISTPLNVIPEFLEERDRFFPALEISWLKTRAEIEAWLLSEQPGIVLINSEKFGTGKFAEMRRLEFFVLDEASILKTIGGTTKWNIIHSTRGIPWLLALTATPAPNEVWEYASQAGFIGRLKDKDPEFWAMFCFNEETREWEIKPHARHAFYKHLSTWSIYLRDPAIYGWLDEAPPVPEPTYHDHPIPPTDEQLAISSEILHSASRGLLYDEAKLDVKLRLKLSQLAKGFLYTPKPGRNVDSLKPAKVAELAAQEIAAGRQVVIWTIFDQEAHLIEIELRKLGVGFDHIQGWDKPEQRLETVQAYKRGEIKCLITKPQLLAFGINLQACGSMIFSGFDDSYERMYQAIRRAVRVGQTKNVRLHFVYIPELEGLMLQNLFRKRDRFEQDCTEMERAYAEALREAA